MHLQRQNTVVLLAVLLAAISLSYSNHFQNSFHFDDSHTVQDNPYIRSMRNLPLIFADAGTFSVLPANRGYRPIVTSSLAIDYWLGSGLNPVYFHASTFFWFLVQLVLMSALFRKVCDIARPDARNEWIVFLAVGLYGLHPAIAETVNYVIQRGDVYSTLGVIAGLAFYALAPASRRLWLYLLPVAAGILSKPPALIFPAILFVYVWLFEEGKPLRAFQRCVPALGVAIAFGYLVSAMTPPGYNPGATSAYAYRLTQPLVALRYFRNFFIPTHLSADTDFAPINRFLERGAWLGFLFVVALIVVVVLCSRRRELRPIAFGLSWFLLGLLPTAMFPLAEVENDHRMYLPFVGLVLAACWPIALWTHRTQPVPWPRIVAVTALCVAVLCASAWGVRQRNEVWRTEESLWQDVTVKSPKNGRGLMNYGLTQMEKGETAKALEYFQRAALYTPAYYALEINLGIANGALKQDAPAEQHFLRAITLAPEQADTHYFYARWLQPIGRRPEAIEHLHRAITANPDYLPAQYLLMETLEKQGERAQLKAVAESALRRFPSDSTAAKYLLLAESREPTARVLMTAEDYLKLSLSYHRIGKFQEAIAAAREALKLRADYAEAYNNIAAAYEDLEMWDSAIEAARQALKIRPDFELAQNNLLWAQQQKKKAEAGK
ncbi:MAG TPA: tetratricopeptide repeat protein [Terriglobia bacterium]|nr:tetratricopeptide repeat protein [Terriglobia bacterium]